MSLRMMTVIGLYPGTSIPSRMEISDGDSEVDEEIHRICKKRRKEMKQLFPHPSYNLRMSKDSPIDHISRFKF